MLTIITKLKILSSLTRKVNALCLFGAFMVVLFSCEQENEFVIPLTDTPVLATSSEEVVLFQKQSSNTALSLSWSRGSNRGTDAAIDYVIQLAPTTDFQNPHEIEVGRVKYSYDMQTAALNNLLLNQFGFDAGQPATVAARVVTIVADETVEPEYSNAVEIAVTPFQPVSETLYLIGDAAPNGWDAANATPLTASTSAPGIFTYSGNLSNGELKFITTLGEFLPSYNKGEGDATLFYRTDDAQPDEKFVIDQTGQYTITVDLIELTVSIAKLDQPPFSEIYIVGDASPSGWNIDSPEAFTQSETDPFIFTYEALLNEGDFKILAGATGDWCGQWYRPLVDGETLTSSDVEQNSGCDTDNKWRVTAETKGFYKITLDTREVSVKFEKVDLYLVGDAGPNGWNIANPEPMTTTGDGVYTYSGPLTAGELKISKFKGDWCNGEWINSATPDQAVSNGDYIVTQGCDGPDNKWRVTDVTAGNYDITIDLNAGTVTFEKQ